MHDLDACMTCPHTNLNILSAHQHFSTSSRVLYFFNAYTMKKQSNDDDDDVYQHLKFTQLRKVYLLLLSSSSSTSDVCHPYILLTSHI